MANYWAITIGINQYRHLQPLMHAQNDALFMHRFLTEKAGIAQSNCVLLSDLATSVGHQVVYPDKPALAEWIQTITQNVQAGDVLWFFFSGYGVQLEGADYLMPIDGNPGTDNDASALKETGIAVADLIHTLADLPANDVLLVLDINRSQGSFSGQTIGTETINLAKERQLPLMLSCQPEQYSHETLGVRHGLFTAALLEALQQQCTTLEQIKDYVGKRLPELCEHHWRPIQNPVSLIPDYLKFAAVVPKVQPVTDVASAPVVAADSQSISSSESVAVGAAQSRDSVGEQSTQVLAGAGGTLLTAKEAESINGNSADVDSVIRDITSSSALANTPDKGAIVPLKKEAAPAAINGAKLLNWGLLALGILMAGVLIKQPFVRTAWRNLRREPTAVENPPAETAAASEETTATTPVLEPAESETANTSEAASESAPDESAPDENASAEAASAEAASAEAASAETASAETASAENTEEAEAVGSASNNAAENEETQPAESDLAAASNNESDDAVKALLAEADNAIQQRKYADALAILQQVPRGQRDSSFSSLLTKVRAGQADSREINASTLTAARTAIQPTQASPFADAIAQASLIQPGEPYHDQAQADIRSWSQTILDIAVGRATSGNLDGAIAAAQVMPPNNAELHQQAQTRIAFWQQRQRSREIISEAQRIPKSGQASTYQQGIVKLREVPIDHPEYETAQRLADEWSERIFSIAQARAAQNRNRAAIQAAVLVPAGTTAYEPTQQAIRRWEAE
ncbi:MAG: caspase family protein [Cyanobacteria bacterium J06627_28]